MQELRDNAEWRRWEQADKWRWREGERREWAERLWRGQHERRIARVKYITGQTRERLRHEAEAAQASCPLPPPPPPPPPPQNHSQQICCLQDLTIAGAQRLRR